MTISSFFSCDSTTCYRESEKPPDLLRRGLVLTPACSLLLRGQLDHRHCAARYLRHLPIPALGHLVLHERARDAAREQLVRFRLGFCFGHDRLGAPSRLDRVT